MAYKTMAIGISKSRQTTKEKLDELCNTLSCRTSDLVWLGIEHVLANPPEEAPRGSREATGTASGFWIVAVTDKSGKAINFNVIEVEKRTDEAGMLGGFYRYGPGDEKQRIRALKQALHAAAYQLTLIGKKPDGLRPNLLRPLREG